MKKSLSTQAIIFIFATALSLMITFYVGSFMAKPLQFYWSTLLINLTFIGDSYFAFGLVFFLLFYFNQKKMATKLFFTTLFTLVSVQLIKNICSNQPFQIFFEPGIVTHETQNIFYHNFISSHTALAFTLAIFLTMHIKKLAYTILFFIVAFFVTYTRIAIAQESIIAILLGILPAFGSYFIIKKMSNGYASNKRYYFRSSKSRKINTQQLLRV
jgi:membrane-associated phospholipid phosphatase